MKVSVIVITSKFSGEITHLNSSIMFLRLRGLQFTIFRFLNIGGVTGGFT